jgi:hypothetical protein
LLTRFARARARRYKDREDLPAEQQKVTCNPDVTVCARTPEDEFVVLACDGIWDVASNEEGTAMVQAILDEGEGTVSSSVCAIPLRSNLPPPPPPPCPTPHSPSTSRRRSSTLAWRRAAATT